MRALVAPTRTQTRCVWAWSDWCVTDSNVQMLHAYVLSHRCVCTWTWSCGLYRVLSDSGSCSGNGTFSFPLRSWIGLDTHEEAFMLAKKEESKFWRGR